MVNDEHDNRLDDAAALDKFGRTPAERAAEHYAADLIPSPSQRRLRQRMRRAFLAGVQWHETQHITSEAMGKHARPTPLVMPTATGNHGSEL